MAPSEPNLYHCRFFRFCRRCVPDQVSARRPAGRDWVKQFGFIPGSPDVNEASLSASLFRITCRVPVLHPGQFVGFSCSACHTSLIRRTEDDRGVMVYGMGSTSVDVFGWADALKTALLDEQRLNMDTIEEPIKPVRQAAGFLDKIVIRYGCRVSGMCEGPRCRNTTHRSAARISGIPA